MTSDPVLTAIAVGTNDALPEHLWRYDTADGDPIADVALALHRAAYEFTGISQLLARTLQRLHERCGNHLDTLISYAAVHRPNGLDSEVLKLMQLLERHDSQRDALLATYAVWRRHRPTSRDPRVRYLLPQPYDPTHGIVTLGADDTGTCWYVVPDTVAVEAFGLSMAPGVIGEIRPTGTGGWQATALTHPEHRTTCPHLVYPLPDTDDEAAACRSLLRWWALRDSDHWHGRTPAQLTGAERAALAA